MEEKFEEEIIKKIQEGSYISKEAFNIGQAALKGMLYEASSSPSPGLVSPNSCGAHRDMDYFMFLRSTAVISKTMYICAQIGIEYDDKILERIRVAGIYGEKDMLKETCGVNTQKGLIFLGGLVCACAGRCIRLKQKINAENIGKICSELCIGIVKRELELIVVPKTNGEKLYKKYKIEGIRGEVEGGLKTVINNALPVYKECINESMSLNDSLCHTLIHIMTIIEDTTVINRCGIQWHNYMHRCALNALLLGGMKTQKGRAYINDMDKDFIEKNISAGGAADLLAVTVMIYDIENFKMQ